MPTESSITQAQGLLVELASKQLFLDQLTKLESTKPAITVSVQKITSTFSSNTLNVEYGKLLDQIITTVRADIGVIKQRVNELLQ